MMIPLYAAIYHNTSEFKGPYVKHVFMPTVETTRLEVVFNDSSVLSLPVCTGLDGVEQLLVLFLQKVVVFESCCLHFLFCFVFLLQ